MKKLIALAAIYISMLGAVSAQTELVTNGGFESGSSPWVLVGTAGAGVAADPTHAQGGANYLSMGNIAGAAQGVYQTITIPTNAAAVVLSYFWTGFSTDVAATDRLRVLLVSTNQNILATLDTESNSTVDGMYHQKTFNLAAYVGQKIEIYFDVSTDGAFGGLTSFHIDDVSVMYVTATNLPANDNFINRTVILASSTTLHGDNLFASKEPGEASHAGNAGGASLWWSWSTLLNGTVTISTTGSSIDTVLAIYTGNNVSNLVSVASNDDENTDPRSAITTSKVKFTAVSGVNYQIAVDGKDRVAGAISLVIAFTPDTKAPTVSISSPSSGAKVTNSTVTIFGKATDDLGIAQVQFRLENAAGTNSYQIATGSNSWSATVDGLIPGPNTIRVRAFDVSSNLSKTVTRVINYVVTSPLTLTVSGSGTVTPNLNGQALSVGSTYKLTAKPGVGQLFGGWGGDIETNTSVLNFMMQSNLVLQANFVPNPFIPVVGIYQGLFSNPEDPVNSSSGIVTLTLTTSGSFSGKILLAGKTISCSGIFNPDGTFSKSIARKGSTPLFLTVTIDFAFGTMTGFVSSDSFNSPLVLYRNPFSKTNPTPLAGKYTMTFTGSEDFTTQPGGDSYATLTISPSGLLTMSGALADGTKITQKSYLLTQSLWPLYVSLYGGQGFLLGWMDFESHLQSDFTGQINWAKPPQPSAKYYPAGFSIGAAVTGSAFHFNAGAPVLTWSNGELLLIGGALPQNILNEVSLSAANKITNLSSNKLTLTVTTSSGMFKGAVTDPSSGENISFNGVVIQKMNAGFGFFLRTNVSGEVHLNAVPAGLAMPIAR